MKRLGIDQAKQLAEQSARSGAGQRGPAASSIFRLQSVGFLSFRLAHLFEHRLDQRLAQHGVNVGQLRVMFVLWEAGESTQTEIARHLGVAQPTIAKTLDRMVRDGLASKRPDPEHGRRVLVRLTGKADALRDDLLHEAQALNELALAAVPSEQRAQVAAILTRLGDGLEASLPARSDHTGHEPGAFDA